MFAAASLVLFGLSAGPSALVVETWTDVALVDTMCARKVQKDPDSHPKECAVKCANSGYGIILADGTLLKLDKAGNEQAVVALKATEKKDHLRVTVTGDRSGDTIAVKTLELK
jgi:hypothetical protein